jgi:mono/diheme cytochrome c family protein
MLGRIYYFITIVIMGVTVIPGCYYDVEEELYGGCDTSMSTYSKTVTPMLQANGCIGCHSGNSPSGNVVLNNYDSIASLVQQNRFISGADRMPPAAPILNECDMNKLRAWVAAGALNN